MKAYEQAGLLRTEHAAIDDGGGGKLAGTQFLTARPSDGGLKVDTSDPAMRALVAEREAIQKQIDALRAEEGRARSGALRSGTGTAADEPRAEDEGDPRSEAREEARRQP